MEILFKGSVLELRELSAVFVVIDKEASMPIEGLAEMTAEDVRAVVKEELKLDRDKHGLIKIDTLEDNIATGPLGKEKTSPKKKASLKTATPAGDVTIDDIKQDVNIDDYDSIPELIEGIKANCGINGSQLGRLIELTPSEISQAKNGKTYPYIIRKFKQYFGFDKEV